MGESVLRARSTPIRRARAGSGPSAAPTPERESGQYSRTGTRIGGPVLASVPRGGDASELGDVGASSGKSSLFFLTGPSPGMGLPRDRVARPAKRCTSCSVRCAGASP